MSTRRSHDIAREEPHHVKVMLRLDRRFRERCPHTYHGYTVKGRIYSRLNFDHGMIVIGLFGDLYWVPAFKSPFGE